MKDFQSEVARKISLYLGTDALCPELFEKSADQLLDWLNEPFLKSEVKAIKAGLRKKNICASA